MTPPPIDLQRRVALDLARAHGVPLVTPDSPSALREAIAALVSLVSSRVCAVSAAPLQPRRPAQGCPMTLRLLLAVALVGCVTARRAVIAATPTVPAASGVACPAVPWRCSAGVPEHCHERDNVARWYPLHPLADDGRPAPCANACVLSGNPVVAHCAAEVTP